MTDPATDLSCVTGARHGKCEITDVPPGDYWIVETDAPDGYDTATPKPITVGVGDEAPQRRRCRRESPSSTLASTASSCIVCHEGSDTLFSRDVTVDGETKPSLPAGSLGRSRSEGSSATPAERASATSAGTGP